VEGSDDEIGDAEGHSVAAKAARRCQRDDEHRRDRGEHRDLTIRLVGGALHDLTSVNAKVPPEGLVDAQSCG
jgi:hypothetical protein